MQCNGNEFFQQRGIVFIENFHVFGICGRCVWLYLQCHYIRVLVDVHKRSVNLSFSSVFFVQPCLCKTGMEKYLNLGH